MRIKRPGRVGVRKKGFIFLVLLCIFGGLSFYSHTQAWDPEDENCPNVNKKLEDGNTVNTGPMDGRCHYAKTDTNGATITDSAGVTKPLDNNNPTTNTAHPGDTLTFRFHANSSNGSGSAQDVTMLNWANITLKPENGVVLNVTRGSLLDPPGSRYDNWCLLGKDSDKSFDEYSCDTSSDPQPTQANNIGKNVYSIQHIPAGQNSSDDYISFTVHITPTAAVGASVCTRFHASEFSTVGLNKWSTSTDLEQIAQTQFNTHTNDFDVGGHQISPTWAASNRWCVKIQSQPCGSFCASNGPSCNGSPSTYTGALGGSVGVTVNFTNDSATTWWVGTGSTANGYSNNPAAANLPPAPPDITQPPFTNSNYLYHYPNTTPGFPNVTGDKDWTDKQHDAVMTDGTYPNLSTEQLLNGGVNAFGGPESTANFAPGATTQRTFTITNGGTLGPQVYYFGIVNAEKAFAYEPPFGQPSQGDVRNALYGNNAKLCSVVINWTGGTIDQFDCQVTHVTGPGSYGYHLQFVDSNGGVTNYPASGSITGNLDTRPATGGGTFLTFGFMQPYLGYTAQIIADGVGPTGGAVYLTNNGNPSTCMDASCEVSIDTGGNIVEPGQTVSAKYGINITNYTNKTFTGYNVVIAGQPGLSGGTTDTDSLVPGTAAHDGPFSMTANYGGYATADLYLATSPPTPLDGYFPGLGCRSADYNPQTRPTMKVTNGDISTGGGFAYQNACDLTTTFTGAGASTRYISPSSTGQSYSGGIRTFANPDALKGSGSDFAALALGYINGGKDGPYGFYSSALSTGGPNYASLNFANTTNNGGPSLGGLLGGQNVAAHCAPDYFNNTRIGVLTAQNTGNVQLGSFGMNTSTQELYTKPSGQPCLRISGTMNVGTKVTIYTPDDVCIDNPITYSDWTINTTDYSNTAPYLTIITTGGIYVQPNVNTITGLFIAQPKDDGSGGIFTTCGVDNTVALAAYLAGNCHSQLKVNGSVIAQHIYPIRPGDSLCQYDSSNPCPSEGAGSPSEDFDYSPSAAISSPYLAPICGGAAVDSCEESQVNLPPVF